MWTINQVEQFGHRSGVWALSHRDEPRSGRGCFGAVVVVPFLALGGMFALIAFTGDAGESPVGAPPVTRPTWSWLAEPAETGVVLSTVTETVVRGGGRVAVPASTVTRTVRGTATATATSVVKPSAVGRSEPEVEAGAVEETRPSTPDSSPPVVTSAAVPVPSSVEAPVSSAATTPEAPSERSLPVAVEGSGPVSGAGLGPGPRQLIEDRPSPHV
jgi:hypothetical protein